MRFLPQILTYQKHTYVSYCLLEHFLRSEFKTSTSLEDHNDFIKNCSFEEKNLFAFVEIASGFDLEKNPSKFFTYDKIKQYLTQYLALMSSEVINEENFSKIEARFQAFMSFLANHQLLTEEQFQSYSSRFIQEGSYFPLYDKSHQSQKSFIIPTLWHCPPFKLPLREYNSALSQWPLNHQIPPMFPDHPAEISKFEYEMAEVIRYNLIKNAEKSGNNFIHQPEKLLLLALVYGKYCAFFARLILLKKKSLQRISEYYEFFVRSITFWGGSDFFFKYPIFC